MVWEVSNDTGYVATPQGGESLLFCDSCKAVYDSFVMLVRFQVFWGILYL